MYFLIRELSEKNANNALSKNMSLDSPFLLFKLMANLQQYRIFEFLVLAVVSFARVSGSASLEAE
jgi:hypothetical protein